MEKTFYKNKIPHILFILFISLLGKFFYFCKKQKPFKSYLTLALPFDPSGSLFPPFSSSIAKILVRHLYEGLTRINAQGQVELALAKEIFISEDHKKYTFFLDGQLWSDGTPLTAFDLERSWKNAILNQQDVNYANKMRSIVGVVDFLEKRIPWEEVGIKALKSDTFQVLLQQPNLSFLKDLSLPLFMPRGTIFIGGKKQEKNNGPFIIQSWNPGNLIFKKNPFYSSVEEIHIDEVSVLFLRDEKLAFSLLEQGHIDFSIFYDKIELSEQLIFPKPYLLHIIGQSGLTAALFFNRNKSPLDDLKIRKALSLVIQRELFTKNHFHLDVPAYHLTPAPFNPHEENTNFDICIQDFHFSPLLFEQTTLLALEESPSNEVQYIIQQAWTQTLGVSVLIENPPLEKGIQQLLAGHFDMALLFYQNDYTEMCSLLESFLNGPLSYLLTTQEKKRAASHPESLGKIAELLLENYVVIPLYHPGYLCGTRLGLKGVVLDPFFQDVDFSRAYWDNNSSLKSG